MARFGRMLALVAAYHVLVLLGAVLLGWGYSSQNLVYSTFGWLLVAIGIFSLLAVVAVSLRLTQSAPRSVAPQDGRGVPAGRMGLCLTCGWRGSVRGPNCPICRRPVIRFG